MKFFQLILLTCASSVYAHGPQATSPAGASSSASVPKEQTKAWNLTSMWICEYYETAAKAYGQKVKACPAMDSSELARFWSAPMNDIFNLSDPATNKKIRERTFNDLLSLLELKRDMFPKLSFDSNLVRRWIKDSSSLGELRQALWYNVTYPADWLK